MKRLFGQRGAAPPPKPTMSDATSGLGGREEQLDGKIKKLDDDLLAIRTQMQKTRGPQQERLKQRAMQLLKQRRMYDSQRTQVFQQKSNMEQLQFTKDMMEDTKLQVAVLKETKKEMTKTFKNFSIDEVERMQDDLAELYEQHQEIQEVMGRAYGVSDDVDEDDLAEELDALAFDMEKDKEASYLDDALTTPGTKLPELNAPGVPVPTTPLPAQQQQETDPYQLEAQLGL